MNAGSTNIYAPAPVASSYIGGTVLPILRPAEDTGNPIAFIRLVAQIAARQATIAGTVEARSC